VGLQRSQSYQCDLAGDEGINRGLVWEWICSGIERDERYTPEDILNGISSGEFQLFVYPKGLVVTQVTGHKRLLVFLISGEDLDEWKEKANQDLISYARSLGVDVLEAYCRKGLEKKLQEIGWRTEQVVMRLRL